MTKQEIADQILELAKQATNNADTCYQSHNDELYDVWRFVFVELFNIQKTIRNEATL